MTDEQRIKILEADGWIANTYGPFPVLRNSRYYDGSHVWLETAWALYRVDNPLADIVVLVEEASQ